MKPAMKGRLRIALRALQLAPALVLAMLAFAGLAAAQSAGGGPTPPQVAESGYRFDNATPAWAQGEGPVIAIHRHVSPHVQRGSMEPFATLARSDGFSVEWLDQPLSQAALDRTAILAVVNPYFREGQLDYRNYSTLDAPSVYSPEEIAMIRNWVEGGGALLVLADHSPFAGGAIALMAAFGHTALTGSVVPVGSTYDTLVVEVDFRRDGGSPTSGRLSEHVITQGGPGRSEISHFRTFGGQAIIPSATAQNLLTLPDGYETVLTFALPRDFDTAPRIDSSGLSQGAVEDIGGGRIALFGETGAFTSQTLRGSRPFGLSDPAAEQNAEFVLSLLRWLVRYEP